MVKLNPLEARTDLTSRELAKLIGSFFAGLIQLADIDELKVACSWWAENPEGWMQLKAIKTLYTMDEPKFVDIERELKSKH